MRFEIRPEMTMFAIIETGGHQFKVEKGMHLQMEKIEGEVGKKIVFSDVLLIADGDEVKIGQPHVAGTSVEAKIVGQGKDKKITIIKKIAKKRKETKMGHRQFFTEVEITGIKSGGVKKAAVKKEKVEKE